MSVQIDYVSVFYEHVEMWENHAHASLSLWNFLHVARIGLVESNEEGQHDDRGDRGVRKHILVRLA